MEQQPKEPTPIPLPLKRQPSRTKNVRSASITASSRVTATTRLETDDSESPRTYSKSREEKIAVLARWIGDSILADIKPNLNEVQKQSRDVTSVAEAAPLVKFVKITQLVIDQIRGYVPLRDKTPLITDTESKFAVLQRLISNAFLDLELALIDILRWSELTKDSNAIVQVVRHLQKLSQIFQIAPKPAQPSSLHPVAKEHESSVVSNQVDEATDPKTSPSITPVSSPTAKKMASPRAVSVSLSHSTPYEHVQVGTTFSQSAMPPSRMTAGLNVQTNNTIIPNNNVTAGRTSLASNNAVETNNNNLPLGTSAQNKSPNETRRSSQSSPQILATNLTEINQTATKKNLSNISNINGHPNNSINKN